MLSIDLVDAGKLVTGWQVAGLPCFESMGVYLFSLAKPSFKFFVRSYL